MSQTDGVGKWTWNSLPEQEFSFEFEFFSNNEKFSGITRSYLPKGTQLISDLQYIGEQLIIVYDENDEADEGWNLNYKTIEIKTPITDAEILNTLTTYTTFEATEEPGGGGELK